jgi:3-oxoadipate enol-lactonase
MMHAAVGEITMRYALDGPQGAPWVVLSNSLATTLEMWDEQIPALTRHFRVLRYDQRGHGGTDAPAGPYTFDALVTDLELLLGRLGIDRAHVVGLSMGGTTALGLARRRPGLVDRLVVCDTPAASSPASARQWAQRVALAERDGMAALVEETVGRWFPPEVLAANPPYVDRVRGMIKATPVAGFCGGAAALADVDYASDVHRVAAPTLFVVGSRDGVLGEAMRGLHRSLPGSAFVELAGAGHLSHLDAPREFSAAVTDFLWEESTR